MSPRPGRAPRMTTTPANDRPASGETVSDNSVALPTREVSVRRLRYLASFVRPHKRGFVSSVIAAIIATVAATAVPFLLKHAIERGGFTKGAGQIDFGSVTLWLSLVSGMVALGWIATTLQTYWSIWSVRVVNDLRTALYAHVQRQGLDFFSRQRTGTVISRLTNDIEALAQLVTEGVFMVFVNLLTLVLIEGFLFALDWHLALAVNAIFPIMLAATIAFRYYSTRAYRRTRERMAHVTAFLAESLAGMRVVQAFAAEERAAEEFERTNVHYRKANMETIYLSAAYFPGVELLAAIGTGIVLWYGGFLAQSNIVDVSVLFAFILYLEIFFDPIQQLSQFYGTFLSAMAALDKIMGVMETEPTIMDAPDAVTLPAVRGDVRFHHVGFHYDADGPEVLHDVDLTITAGETIALVGHTGAGKSTFVKLLSRFYDPSSGTVTLDGVDLRQLEQRWLRRSMGIVPQEGFLFAGTVRDNIRYGEPDADETRVRAAAEAVGADHFIDELEHGYDTDVGERGSRLSAGQRQLVAFARAMLTDPPLLVLDEATSSVDVATELRLADGLTALVAGRTAFIVAHRLSTIRDADRILVIDDGRVAEQGTHDELIAVGGFYAGLYGTWTGGTDAPEPTIESRLAET
ncbi:MAG: ABC transporter ATP-binding protein [Thermoleophilia bacterium]|nr:ABC transporter ATP-binding protein [Thermoleophilia bacterium]